MKKLIFLASITLLTFMSCSLLQAQSPSNPQWQKLSSTPGKFTIEMPGQPIQITTNPATGLTIYQYTAIHNDSFYLVAHSTFRKYFPEPKVPEILSLFEKALKDSLINGQIMNQVPIIKQGVSCQEFMVTGKPDSNLNQEALSSGVQLKEQNIYIKGVHCLKGSHFVEASLTSQSLGEIQKNEARFFKSFKLTM